MLGAAHKPAVRVFLSHAWVDLSSSRTAENPLRGLAPVLRDALIRQGIEVFYDEGDIEELDDIERRIVDDLQSCALMVCWYSDAYLERRACQWELLTALTTAPQRVVVINPEERTDHVMPDSLRSELIPTARQADDHTGWNLLAEKIVSRAATLDGSFGEVAGGDASLWFGDPPTRFARFVGRARTMWELDSALRPAPAASGGKPPAEAVVVHGLGGAGKTAFVCEYAARFSIAYPGGIYWLRAGGAEEDPESMAALSGLHNEQLIRIASQIESSLAVAATDDDDLVKAAEAVIRNRLQEGGSFLWIVDDLPAGLPTAEFRRWLPPARGGRVVVTSRGTIYRHVKNIALQEMPLDEAVELLHSAGRGAPLDSDLTQEVAIRLGCLPLALESVGSLMAIPGVSLDTVLAELEDPVELADRAASNPFMSASPTEHPLKITATFGPTLTRLDNATFGLLATAAALSGGPLPVALVRSVAQATLNIAANALEYSLGLLMSRSLVRPVDHESFEVHPLVGGAALQWVADRAWFDTACSSQAAREAEALLGDVEDIGTHAGSRRIAAFAQGLVASQRVYEDAADEFKLLRALARYLHVEHRYTEAGHVGQRALAIAKAHLGENERATLTAEIELAITVQYLGLESEARTMLEHALAGLELQFGSDDIDVLTTKHNLVSRLWSSDRDRARTLATDVYDARMRVLGPEHSHTLFALHTMLSYDLVPPGYEDAVSAYEDLIAKRAAVLGPDHTTTLTSLSNFTERLLRVGNVEKAVALARRLVERRTVLYGPTHVATLDALGRLASALAALPCPPIDELKQLVDRLEQALSPEPGNPSRSVLRALSTAGENLRRSGDPCAATDVLSRLLPIAVEAFGESDRDVLLIEHNLGGAQASEGELAAAVERFDGLIPRMHALLDPSDALTLRARRQRAILYARTGKLARATETQRELAETWRRLTGDASPEYAEALGDLASTLEAGGHSAEAERCREEQRNTGRADEVGRGAYV